MLNDIEFSFCGYHDKEVKLSHLISPHFDNCSLFFLPSITHARETRITAILAHILIGLSILMLPIPLQWIPRPVLDGLFLYLAVTALGSNQMFERITLLVTEQVNNLSLIYTAMQEEAQFMIMIYAYHAI